MKKLIVPKWQLKFMGSSEPFIIPKRVATTPSSLAREGVELIFKMHGCFYAYYIKGIPAPLSKMHMTASVFVTNMGEIFRASLGTTKDEDEPVEINAVWVIYQNGYHQHVRAVRLNKRQNQ